PHLNWRLEREYFADFECLCARRREHCDRERRDREELLGGGHGVTPAGRQNKRLSKVRAMLSTPARATLQNDCLAGRAVIRAFSISYANCTGWRWRKYSIDTLTIG